MIEIVVFLIYGATPIILPVLIFSGVTGIQIAGVVIGLMAFGFFGRKVGFTLGGLAFLVLAPFAFGFLRDYPVLLSSLKSKGVS